MGEVSKRQLQKLARTNLTLLAPGNQHKHLDRDVRAGYRWVPGPRGNYHPAYGQWVHDAIRPTPARERARQVVVDIEAYVRGEQPPVAADMARAVARFNSALAEHARYAWTFRRLRALDAVHAGEAAARADLAELVVEEPDPMPAAAVVPFPAFLGGEGGDLDADPQPAAR